MAFRLYLNNQAPAYTPATKRGSWNVSTSTVARELGQERLGASTTSASAEATTTVNWQVLLGRFISDGFQASGTISSATALLMMKALESNAAADMYLAVHIYVTQGDSDTPRGTLLSTTSAGAEFATGTNRGRGTGALTLSSLAVNAGDRLVVEVGYQARNTVATSYTGTLRYGGTNAVDTAENTTTNARPGYVEFTGMDALFGRQWSGFSDDFNDNSIDATKWNNWGGAAVTESSQQLNISTGTAANTYAGMDNLYRRSLIGQSVFCQVVNAGTQAAAYGLYPIQLQISGSNTVYWYINNGVAYPYKAVQGTFTQINTGRTHTDGDWYRIREDSGTTYWEYSTNGTSWTVQASEANPIPMGLLLMSVFTEVTATYVGSTAIIDNFNVAPSSGNNWTANPSDSITTTDANVKTVGKKPADTVTVTDAIAKTVRPPKSDSVTVTDAAVKTITKTLTDFTTALENRFGYFPGTSGSYASTPDNAAYPAYNDIDIRVRVAMDDWTPAAASTLMAKYVVTGNQRQFRFYVRADGKLQYDFSLNGSDFQPAVSTAATGFLDGSAQWVRVTRAVMSGDVIFYTAPDQDGIPTTWTQLGTTVNVMALMGSFDSTAPLEVGTQDNGTGQRAAADIIRAVLYNDLGTTIVADFNPRYAPAAGVTSFTDVAGKVWTMNGSASLVGERRKIVGKGLTDSVTTTDSASTTVTYVRTPADTVTATDAIVKSITKRPADTVTPSDTATPVKLQRVTPADTVTPVDAAVKSVRPVKTDVTAAVDTISKSVTKRPADTAAAADAAIKSPTKRPADTVTTTDASARTITKRPVDNVSTTDVMTRTVTYLRQIADTVTATDLVRKAVSHPQSDTVVTSDSASEANNVTLNRADTVTPSDAISKSIVKAIADSAAVSETPAAGIVRTRNVSDSAIVTDTYQLRPRKNVNDSVVPVDITEVDVNKTRTDTASVSDTAAKEITKSLGDIISTDDKASPVQVATDVVMAVDVVRIKLNGVSVVVPTADFQLKPQGFTEKVRPVIGIDRPSPLWSTGPVPPASQLQTVDADSAFVDADSPSAESGMMKSGAFPGYAFGRRTAVRGIVEKTIAGWVE